MRIEDYDYDLPPERIAQEPAERREDARLLVLEGDTGGSTHRRVSDLPSLLAPGDLLVVNDTRVRPARLAGRRSGGGAVELLVIEPSPGDGPAAWTALVRCNRPLRAGEVVGLTDGVHPVEGAVRLERRTSDGPWVLVPLGATFPEFMARHGSLPLPPYIRRAPLDPRSAADRERYQTVFAREEGAVAAPTAGLHLTRDVLAAVQARGADVATVTLHVGLGTFLPITARDAREHRMHAEAYAVPALTAAAVRRAHAAGARVVAVGTTTVRTLEAAALASTDGLPEACSGSTDLFIQPGFSFRVVHALLTNFHLPRSTLLCLVAAFAGRERVLDAYREAISVGYRFYSYGDAMFISRPPAVAGRAGRPA